MPPYEELFLRLQDVAELQGLIGKTEDLYLDCKIWPQNENDAQRIVAKALCGFANADGGIIVIGLEAKGGTSKDAPDVIQRAIPVLDAIAVKSRIEGLIGDLVEPRVAGVRLAAVLAPPDPRSGFVLVAVPPHNGLPCRTRKTRDFYQRISSGTYPMEYFQIADMFGKRHRPELHLWLEDGPPERWNESWRREFTLGIENRGRAVAKFPIIRFKGQGIIVSNDGIDGNGRFGLPRRPTEPGWVVFGGGADDVNHPGTLLKIAVLVQRANATGWVDVGSGHQEVAFEEYILTAELSADEMSIITESKTVPGGPLP